jgi:hypothetical protein
MPGANTGPWLSLRQRRISDKFSQNRPELVVANEEPVADLIPAEVPLSFLEFTVAYPGQLLSPRRLYDDALPATFSALKPWGLTPEQVTWKQNAANAAELQVSFTLLNGRVIYSVGIAAARLVVMNPSWEEAELIMQVSNNALATLKKVVDGNIDAQTVTMTLHVKPTGRGLLDITKKFCPATNPELMERKPKGFGFSMSRENATWLVDLSALYPDALFVRISRVFQRGVTLDEIAVELRAEEEGLARLLGVNIL